MIIKICSNHPYGKADGGFQITTTLAQILKENPMISEDEVRDHLSSQGFWEEENSDVWFETVSADR